MAFIDIALMTDNIKHLFLCLFTICMPFFAESLLIPLLIILKSMAGLGQFLLTGLSQYCGLRVSASLYA